MPRGRGVNRTFANRRKEATNSAHVSAAFPAGLEPICWLVGRGCLLEG